MKDIEVQKAAFRLNAIEEAYKKWLKEAAKELKEEKSAEIISKKAVQIARDEKIWAELIKEAKSAVDGAIRRKEAFILLFGGK